MKTQFLELVKMRRQQMGAANRKKTYKTKIPTIVYPRAIETRYAKFINQYMKQFTEPLMAFLTPDMLNEMTRGVRGDSFHVDVSNSESFNQLIRELKQQSNEAFAPGSENRMIVFQTGLNVNEQNSKQVEKQLTKIVGFEYSPVTDWEREVLETWAENDFILINSLSDEYLKKAHLIVSNGVMAGKDSRTIRRELLQLNKTMSVSRARLIARDQVGKLQGRLTERRMQDVGLELYEWVTAGDERVRSSHQEMDGAICRWDNPDVMSDDGKDWFNRPLNMQGLIPGEDIQCRCTAVPYTTEVYKQIDKEL